MSGYSLRFISGKYQGNEYPLKKGEEVVIGRGTDIAITLVEDMISRRHARIVVEDDYIILEDLGSTNGSFVNGERVRKVRIKEGDRILLGTSIIKLVSAEGDNFPDTPSSASQAALPAAKAPGLPAPGLPAPGLPSRAAPPLSIGGGPARGPASAATMAAPAFNAGGPSASTMAAPAFNLGGPSAAPPAGFGGPKPTLAGRAFGSPSSDAMAAPPAATSASLGALNPVAARQPLGVPSAPPSLSFDAPSASLGAPKPAFTPPVKPAASAAFGSPAAAATAAPAFSTEASGFPPLPPPTGPAIMEGDLREMPLADLFDIFVNSRRNGVLLVRGDLDGNLHFRDGRIVFAALSSPVPVPPQKAALRIVGWGQGTYALHPPNDQSITEWINEDPLELLQRAKRQQDELKRYKTDLPPNFKRVRVSLPLKAYLRDLRPEQLDTFQLVLSYGNTEAVLLASEHSESETYQHLVHLFRQQYIQAA